MYLRDLYFFFSFHFPMRSVSDPFNSRRYSFHRQMDRISINTSQFTQRRSVDTTMDFAHGRHGFKGYHLNVDMGSLHPITSGPIVLLLATKWGTKCILGHRRQSVRTVTGASRADHLIQNVSVRRAD